MVPDSKQSMEFVEKAFVEHEDGNLFVQLAEAYRAVGDFDRALRVLRRGLEKHPTFVPGFAMLGMVLRDLGREAEAAVCFEQLLEMDPSNGVARAALGEIAAVLGRGSRSHNGHRNGSGADHAHAAADSRADDVQARGSDSAPSRPIATGSIMSRGGWYTAARPHGDPLWPSVPGAGERSATARDTESADRTDRDGSGDGMSASSGNGRLSEQPAGDSTARDSSGSSMAAADTTTVELADLLVGLLEYRDPFFRGGTSMTRLLAAAIAREMGLDEEMVNAVALAAVLRDLGQIPIKDLIDKSGTELGDDGRRQLARHAETTLELLDRVELPDVTREAILYHHEWWNGDGYAGLVGEAIPLGARVVAVADSFAAMIAARAHRLPMRAPDALVNMRTRSGKQYDPDVVETLAIVLTSKDWRGLPFGLRHRVLVVDPDDTRAMVLATKLCSNGYLAETASSAEAARERLLHTRIVGLIVSAELDEGRDGSLLREVREGGRLDMIPVIVTEADNAHRVKLLESGADVCLTTSSSYSELKATLEAFLRREGNPVPAASADDAAWSGLQGDIEEFPLGWLLQVLNYDSRTAAVFIAGKGDAGAIYLDHGSPRHAQTISLRGEDALREMLTWPAGSFSVDPDTTTSEETIQSSLMNLLLEDAVRDDHAEFFGAVKV